MGVTDGTILGLTQILDNGPAANRFNIVIVSEGYSTDRDLSSFNFICNSVVQALRDEPFLRHLVPALNVYRLNVRSNETGADHPATCGGSSTGRSTTVATYFDATFCGDGETPRCLSVDAALVRSTLDAQLPEWHVAAVIVNDNDIGGCAFGNVFTTSIADRSGLGSYDAVDVVLHELGHAAFGLADEYETLQGCASGETGHDRAPAGEPMEPNITSARTLGELKWAARVDTTTPVPTMLNPDCSQCDGRPNVLDDNLRIGLFEGAGYYHCGRFRPAYGCRMRTHSDAYCRVCVDAIIARLADFFDGAPTLVATATELDFGGLGTGATVAIELEVVNVGRPDVTGIAVASDNGAFVPSLLGGGGPLRTGERRTVRVALGPVLVNGPVNANLSITSNAAPLTIPMLGDICTPVPRATIVGDSGGRTLDFGTVARGLTMYRSFEIRNGRTFCPDEIRITLLAPTAPFAYAPGTPLNFTVEVPPPPTPGLPVPPRAARKVFVSFTAPSSGPTGVVSGSLTIEGNGLGTLASARTLTLTANVVDPFPVDSVLVIDRSGSMIEPTGVPGRDKADLALQAAQLYVDLLKENDRIGLVRFNHRSSAAEDVLSPLVLAGASSDAAAPRFTVRSLLDRRNFTPDGATSIGGGTIRGSSVLDSAVASSRAVVVLTDGIQNTDPDIPEATRIVAAKSPRQRVFAVGLGLNQLEDRLVQLSSVTNGHAQITGGLVDRREFLLQKLYVQILSDAADDAFVMDPVETLFPGGERATDVFIGEVDVAADFIVVFRKTAVQPSYASVWLEAPDGTIVSPEDVVPNFSYFDGSTHRYFRVNLPAFPDRSRAHVGRWRVWVKNHVSLPPLSYASPHHSLGETLRYSVMCKARSNFRLGGYLVQNAYAPGSPIGIVLEPTLYGQPVTLDSAEVLIERPDGSMRTIDLADGADGRYRGAFDETDLVGPYHFAADVSATTPAHAQVTRYRHMTGIIFRPNQPGRPGSAGGAGPGGAGDPSRDRRDRACQNAWQALDKLTAVLARTPPERIAERARLAASIEALSRFIHECKCCQ